MDKVDDIDKKILNEYLDDARLSYREVAKRLNFAVGTILARTKKLELNNVIVGYTALLNHEKLGYDITAITEIRVSKGKLTEVEKEISKLTPTCAVYDVTGENDVIVIAKFKNRNSMSEFTKKLLSMTHVERTNSRIVLNTVKEDFRFQA